LRWRGGAFASRGGLELHAEAIALAESMSSLSLMARRMVWWLVLLHRDTHLLGLLFLRRPFKGY
jgi:hypothetical protein